jgi:hypothetical protein
MKKLLLLLLLCCISFVSFAQDAPMADLMRSNGKIYVVIAVMLTLVAGLVLYLVRLDNKISKLEKNK